MIKARKFSDLEMDEILRKDHIALCKLSKISNVILLPILAFWAVYALIDLPAHLDTSLLYGWWSCVLFLCPFGFRAYKISTLELELMRSLCIDVEIPEAQCIYREHEYIVPEKRLVLYSLSGFRSPEDIKAFEFESQACATEASIPHQAEQDNFAK